MAHDSSSFYHRKASAFTTKLDNIIQEKSTKGFSSEFNMEVTPKIRQRGKLNQHLSQNFTPFKSLNTQ